MASYIGVFQYTRIQDDVVESHAFGDEQPHPIDKILPPIRP